MRCSKDHPRVSFSAAAPPMGARLPEVHKLALAQRAAPLVQRQRAHARRDGLAVGLRARRRRVGGGDQRLELYVHVVELLRARTCEAVDKSFLILPIP